MSDYRSYKLYSAVERRASTIKYAVPNLRFRWKKELEPYTDNQVAACYEDFALSDEYGNNDELFPNWFIIIQGYPAEGL